MKFGELSLSEYEPFNLDEENAHIMSMIENRISAEMPKDPIATFSVKRINIAPKQPRLESANPTFAVVGDSITVSGSLEAVFAHRAFLYSFFATRRTTKARRKTRRLIRKLARRWLTWDKSGKARALLKKVRNG